jgi:hydrogenase maturation protease
VNRELAQQVAHAVLYEGYMLYPYRPSAIKNRQRWTFGILYPPAYEEVRGATERAVMHSECLVETHGGAVLHVQGRFLHLMRRQVERSVNGKLEPVPSVESHGRRMESWDEGVERSVELELRLFEGGLGRRQFGFPGSEEVEMLRDESGEVIGNVSRTQHEIAGRISVSVEKVQAGLLKLSIDVVNESVLTSNPGDRDGALLQSLLSTHAILTMSDGEFVSLLEPAEKFQEAVSACNNVGNFPVLVGEAGARDMLLCSPIVLYDYPQIAPESAGDFYDGTEMDEMLTLRVMTLTDEEKDEMRRSDDRVRNLLQRTEESAREQLMRTHGVIRSLRPAGNQS